MPANGSTAPLRKLHARTAAARRWDSADKDELAREYAAERLADIIKRTVDAAPPLTSEQRARLSLLLSGGPNDDAAA
jgi:hypothetical protein